MKTAITRGTMIGMLMPEDRTHVIYIIIQNNKRMLHRYRLTKAKISDTLTNISFYGNIWYN